MLKIIGLGLDLNSISNEGLEAVKGSDKVYLESYTVDFPYSFEALKSYLGVEIEDADRNFVESLELVEEAKEQNICLLVYGSPLAATTHVSLIEDCKSSGVGFEVFHNASIFDAVAESGLQLYKFGKTASMPKWKKSYKPESFMEVLKENSSISAHSLILCDIGMSFEDALKQLKEASEDYDFELDSLVVCQALGTGNAKIFYGSLEGLKSLEVEKPYCLIVPGSLQEKEKEFLDIFRV